MNVDKIKEELKQISPKQIVFKSYTPEKKNAIIIPYKLFNKIPLPFPTLNQLLNGFPNRPNVNKGIDNLSMVYNQMLYQTAINDDEKNKEEKNKEEKNTKEKNKLLDVENLNSSFFKKHLKNIFFPILFLSIILISVFFIKYDNTSDKNIKDNFIALGITLSVFWSILYIICIGPYINLIVKNKKLWEIYNIK